jgi:hypothetical protein
MYPIYGWEPLEVVSKLCHHKLQDYMGSAQLPVVSLQGLELLTLAAGHSLGLPQVHLDLLDPFQ